MKFFGTGIVWDKENNKALCQFEKGEYNTSEERKIQILSSLGYTYEAEKAEEKQEEPPVIDEKKGPVKAKKKVQK